MYIWICIQMYNIYIYIYMTTQVYNEMSRERTEALRLARDHTGQAGRTGDLRALRDTSTHRKFTIQCDRCGWT